MNFQVTTATGIPPDEFLFSRLFLDQWYQAFQTKTTNKFITYGNNNSCGVSLDSMKPSLNDHRFLVKCKPKKNRCFCF